MAKKEESQRVFQDAKDMIEYCLGINLSLIQQLELKNVWTIESIVGNSDNPKSDYYYKPACEAAARFMFNNFSIDRLWIKKTLKGYLIPAKSNDPKIIEYIRRQQDRMHYL